MQQGPGGYAINSKRRGPGKVHDYVIFVAQQVIDITVLGSAAGLAQACNGEFAEDCRFSEISDGDEGTVGGV